MFFLSVVNFFALNGRFIVVDVSRDTCGCGREAVGVSLLFSLFFPFLVIPFVFFSFLLPFSSLFFSLLLFSCCSFGDGQGVGGRGSEVVFLSLLLHSVFILLIFIYFLCEGFPFSFDFQFGSRRRCGEVEARFSPSLYRVLPSFSYPNVVSAFYWILPGFNAFYRVLPSFPGCDVGFYWVLLDFTGFYCVLLRFY